MGAGWWENPSEIETGATKGIVWEEGPSPFHAQSAICLCPPQRGRALGQCPLEQGHTFLERPSLEQRVVSFPKISGARKA